MLKQDQFNAWLTSTDYAPNYKTRALMRAAWNEAVYQFKAAMIVEGNACVVANVLLNNVEK